VRSPPVIELNIGLIFMCLVWIATLVDRVFLLSSEFLNAINHETIRMSC